MLSIWHYIVQWFQFNYVPSNGHPFYTGATWANVFVGPIVIAIGWLWSKSKYWPLKPLEHAVHRLHERHDDHDEHLQVIIDHLEHLHSKHDNLHQRQDRHDTLLQEVWDHLGLEVPPSPDESRTDQTPTDQS